MSCSFPLNKLLEYNEYATLQDLEEFKLNPDEDRHSWSDDTRVKRHAKERTDSINDFDTFQSLISIFEDTIDQIHILSGGQRSSNTVEEFNMSMADRIGRSFLYDPIFDKVTCEPYPLYFTKEKLRKALTDGSKINEFLIVIRNELREENSSRSLRSLAHKIIDKRNEELRLLHDEHKNFKKLRNFKQLLANQQREIQNDLDTIRDTLYETKDQTQDLLFENLLREKYVKDWENARQEQNDLFCKRSENELINMIEKCDNEINTESRVNSEEELFLLEEEQDFQYNIKFWTDKLAEESDQRIVQNQILRERSEDMKKMYEDLSVLYESHKKQLKHYLYLKAEREKAWKEKERRRLAATKIQAWWRGIMVRLKLGPFNPNKKRRKGRKGRRGRRGKKAKK